MFIIAMIVLILAAAVIETKLNGHRSWLFVKVFGLYVAAGKGLGNCFSPAIVFNWYGWPKQRSVQELRDELARTTSATKCRMLKSLIEKRENGVVIGSPALASIVVRFKGNETVIHLRKWGMSWNSEHIASKLGKWSEAPHGDVAQYRGILGTHCRW